MINKTFLLLLLAAGLGTAGWAYYRGQVRQQATLQQFILLDKRLATNNQLAKERARTTIEGIIQGVNQNRLQRRDLDILYTAEKIHNRTESLLDSLRALRQQLNGVARANSLNVATPATVGPTASTTLGANIYSYIAFIRQFIPSAAPLTQSPNGFLLSDAIRVEHFKGIPLVAALATCTRLETQIRRYGEEALMSQAMKVSTGCCLCFDRIGLWAVAESKTVAPGAIYRCQLFLTQSSSGGHYSKATVNGKSVQTLYPRYPKAEFRAGPAGPAQPDTVRAQWKGVIQTKWYPTDKVWQLTVPYYIVKTDTP
ncbi:hypothetical protein [Hymenobacter guriensis]|uniref:Gliding motility-associated protein GldM N-terminal domain-containing protein n=1 Tax=Hymenobacter guriensis TaxID=2793065 RepID=A0ABS0L7U6_9BACT|nr:hypothetical protein [Hymenobacter guriensis]MBG8556224.1 hypothetical protein [Hymenobacter guriensis]